MQTDNVSEMGNKYCRECGAKTVRHMTGKYDTKTGAAIAYMRCPTNKCEHAGIHHGYAKPFGFFGIGRKLVCDVCGEKLPFLDDY